MASNRALSAFFVKIMHRKKRRIFVQVAHKTSETLKKRQSKLLATENGKNNLPSNSKTP